MYGCVEDGEMEEPTERTCISDEGRETNSCCSVQTVCEYTGYRRSWRLKN